MAAKKDTSNSKMYHKLRNPYRLVILNVDTFEERFSLILSPLNVFTWGSLVLVSLVLLVVVLLTYTPLKLYLLPGYADNIRTRQIVVNAELMADSLQAEIDRKNQYLYNLKAVLLDHPIASPDAKTVDPNINYQDIEVRPSREDSLLRNEIEDGEQFSLMATDFASVQNGVSSFFFFTPLNGLVSAAFNAQESHFGVDIVAPKNEAIKAILEGTVIFAAWTAETGYVIQVQHNHNLISVYKHNSVLLKKEGERVEAGEAIAIIGESGELTTGPHLHFELWFNGNPVDPQEYMVF